MIPSENVSTCIERRIKRFQSEGTYEEGGKDMENREGREREETHQNRAKLAVGRLGVCSISHLAIP
jgi:hypothetical protein